MTQIIQTNRERKSRIDSGLVERLNNEKIMESKTRPFVQMPKETYLVSFAFVDDKNMFDDIMKYIDRTFPNQKGLIHENTAFDRIMTSHYYGAVMTDMYLRHINSEFRIATLSELEQNKGVLEGPVHTGLILSDRKSSVINRFYKELNDLTRKTSPLWIDLRGLDIDDYAYLHVTQETRFKAHKNLDKDFLYSETDDYGLPVCPDNGERIFCYFSSGFSPYAYYSSGLKFYRGNCEIVLSTRK